MHTAPWSHVPPDDFVAVWRIPAGALAVLSVERGPNTVVVLPHIDLGSFVEETRAALRLPGVAVAFVDGHRSETVCSGRYEDDSERLIDRSTLFPLGCLAKVVTAVLILRARERGQLTLAAPLLDYLAADSPLRTRVRPETALGHLLAHTSAMHSPLDLESPYRRTANQERADSLEGTVRQSREPGLVFSYSHTAYACAALVLETVTKRSWLDLARELFAEFDGEITDAPGDRVPCGHEWHGTRPPRPVSSVRGPTPFRISDAATGASVFSDAPSLAVFGSELLTQDELPRASALLSDKSLELLRRAPWRPKFGGSGYFGVGLKQFASECYGHRGWVTGHHSFLLVCPTRRRILTMLANANTDMLARRLMQLVAGKDFDLKSWFAADRTPVSQHPRIGRYVLGEHSIEIGSKGVSPTYLATSGRTRPGDYTSPVTLFAVAPGVYAAPCPFSSLPGGHPSVLLEFIDDGSVGAGRWLRVNDLIYERAA